MGKDNNEVFYHKNGKLIHYTKKDNNSIEQAVKDKYNKTRKKPLRLPKEEYGEVVHEINNWYPGRYQNKKVITTDIGNYTYVVKINSFNDYEILNKTPIKNRKRTKKWN